MLHHFIFRRGAGREGERRWEGRGSEREKKGEEARHRRAGAEGCKDDTRCGQAMLRSDMNRPGEGVAEDIVRKV